MCGAGFDGEVLGRQRRLMAETPEQKNFSQQTNILGVLFDVVPKETGRP